MNILNNKHLHLYTLEDLRHYTRNSLFT